MFRQIGGTLGVAAFVAILGTPTLATVIDAYNNTRWFMIAAAATAALGRSYVIFPTPCPETQTLLTGGFGLWLWVAGKVVFWLREGEGDGGVEEFEGAALGGCRDGERGHDRVGVWAVSDVVSGEGGEVVEQVTEAVAGLVVSRRGGGWLCGAAVERLAGVTGLSRVGGCGRCRSVGPGAAQVPDEVRGEHADQDVGLDAVFEAVVDRAQVQVVDLDVAPVSFHMGQVFVGDDTGGVELSAGTLVRMT